jgi:hypothetical protein
MLPFLVPALEAFVGFVAGEVLEYGIKKAVKKKGVPSLFDTNTKNLPVPVKSPKKPKTKKNLPVPVEKNLPVPVEKNKNKRDNVLIPTSKSKRKLRPRNFFIPGSDLLGYSFDRLGSSNSRSEVEVDGLVPDLQGLEIKPYEGDTLLDILKTNSQNLNSSLTALTTLVGQGVVVLPLLLNEVKNLTNAVNEISSSLNLSNVIGSSLVQVIEKIDLSNVESILNDVGISLNSISRAKDLEAEYHEFNKNPIQFTTSDGEVIANISPREIKARKNALDYHLANDEATLRFDDLGLNDYEDDDIEKFLELFKFVGIKSDLERLKNGS